MVFCIFSNNICLLSFLLHYRIAFSVVCFSSYIYSAADLHTVGYASSAVMVGKYAVIKKEHLFLQITRHLFTRSFIASLLPKPIIAGPCSAFPFISNAAETKLSSLLLNGLAHSQFICDCIMPKIEPEELAKFIAKPGIFQHNIQSFSARCCALDDTPLSQFTLIQHWIPLLDHHISSLFICCSEYTVALIPCSTGRMISSTPAARASLWGKQVIIHAQKYQRSRELYPYRVFQEVF